MSQKEQPNTVREVSREFMRLMTDHNRMLQRHFGRYGIDLKYIKILEFTVEIGMLILGWYALQFGADPTITIALVAAVVGGWKIIELLAVADELGSVDTDALNDLSELSDQRKRHAESELRRRADFDRDDRDREEAIEELRDELGISHIDPSNSDADEGTNDTDGDP